MDFKNKIILAPIAKVNDIAFRVLCKKYGADIIYSEMVNCNALSRKNKATINMTRTVKEEKPIAIQLFGTKLDNIKKAVNMVKDKCDIIDFNFGCPADKVIKQGAGAALMERPKKVFEIINCLVNSCDLPITAKIRLGYRKKNYLAIAKEIEKAGASAVTLHARTVKQAYSGKADWDAIKELKENLSIPVIGNGDVWSYENYVKMKEYTNCDSVMIARGAMGYPVIFKEIKEQKKIDLTKEDRINLFKEYLELFKKYPEPFPQVKMQALYFLKGFEESAQLRNKIAKAKDMNELNDQILK